MVNWLVVEPYPSEKYDFVSWDDDIPNWIEIIQMFQTTNQNMSKKKTWKVEKSLKPTWNWHAALETVGPNVLVWQLWLPVVSGKIKQKDHGQPLHMHKFTLW